MRALIIRADGSVAHLPEPPKAADIKSLIGASALGAVNLRDGRTMWVDDAGHAKGRPVNRAATEAYHAVCRPGAAHQIVGDVVITNTDVRGDL